MSEYEDKWRRVASEILAADSYTKLRWVKTPAPVLKGELTVLLNKNKLNANTSSMNALVTIIRLAAKEPELFYVNEERRLYAAKLGEVLAARTKGLASPLESAMGFLKIWLKTSQEFFVSNHLKKILQYNTTLLTPVRIPLNDLLILASNWDSNRENTIISISTEYNQTTFERTTK